MKIREICYSDILFSDYILGNMLPLSLDRARPDLVLIARGGLCLRRERRGPEADRATVRRLTAARIDRYGWLKRHYVAGAADDRGTEIKESTRGDVS